MISRTRLMAAAAGSAVIGALALLPGVGATAAAPSRARAAADQQVINAATDPAAAGKALDDHCQVIANCKFVGTSPITTGYSDARILGDTLYNCGQAYAEDSVALSDQRAESTSLSESLSSKVSLGFLGLAKTSIDFEVNSKQLEEVSTTTGDENTVAVPPGWKGWTQTRVSQAQVTGSAYVTDGIHLITVNNFTLAYPGIAKPGDAAVVYDGIREAMPPADIHDRCGTLPQVPGLATSRSALPAASFKVVLCTHRRTSATQRCTTDPAVADLPLTTTTRSTATLSRDHHTYAAGSEDKSRIVLDASRQVRAGAYTLTLTTPHLTTILAVRIH